MAQATDAGGMPGVEGGGDAEGLDYSYMQRVKVYKLNPQGTWDDKGTGHVSIEYMEQSDAAGLVVISEEDTSTLLIHRIAREDIYQRQGQDTIISWLDSDINTDIAVSFQETIGCNYIWEQIQTVQQNYNSGKGDVARTLDAAGSAGGAVRRVVDEFDSQGAGSGSGSSSSGKGEELFSEAAVGPSSVAMDFPEPTMGSIAEIARLVNECGSPYAHEKAAQALLRKGYIRKLLDVFRSMEDLEDADGLVNAFKAVKGVVLLNDTNLFDLLFSEELVMDVVGALEYDPELPTKQNHRQFLREKVVFKEVVPIADPSVRSKIHQTYRIGYIKDVILARVLDDATFNTLSSLMLFNNVEVALALQSEPGFFRELFSRLHSHDPASTEYADLVAFLQELSSIAKYLQPVHRSQLFNTLVNNGLFSVLTVAAGVRAPATKLKALDILLSSLQQDPTSLRNFLNHQENQTLFSLLISGLVLTDQDGVQEQTLEILRLLLDNESVESNVNAFLETFYSKYVDQLVGALAQCLAPREGDAAAAGAPPTTASASTLNLIVELLCFCVKYHSYRIKYYVLRNNVVEKVLKLVQRPERFLVVAAVRFLRTCIGLKDEFYHRYLCRNRLFEPVFEAFVANGDRYNLLNSAVIELVDFIRKENIKSLIAHIVEMYGDQVEGVTYVDTFAQLKLRYEQQREGAGAQLPPGAGAVAPGAGVGASAMLGGAGASAFRHMADGVVSARGRGRRDNAGRGLDKDEEDYFSTESEDDDDDSSGASTAAAAAQRAGSSGGGGRGGERGGAAAPDGGDGAATAAAAAGTSAPAALGSMLVDYHDDEDAPAPSASGAAAAGAPAHAAASGGSASENGGTEAAVGQKRSSAALDGGEGGVRGSNGGDAGGAEGAAKRARGGGEAETAPPPPEAAAAP